MKILFLSQHYWPEPCDTRTSQLAALMAAKGHSATALTTFPNYPFGKVYQGYAQCLVEKEQRDGVAVVRVPMLTDHSKSKMRRGASYLSFCFSSFILGSLFTKRPDLIWIHHPPLTTAVSGFLLSMVKRVPYVLEIHDLWPESLVSTGMISEGFVSRAIDTVSLFLMRRASRTIVSSPGMKRHLVQKGIREDKVSVVYQWTDEKAFQPVERDGNIGSKLGLVGKTNIVFAGNQGTAQSLDTVLDAAKLLSDVPHLQFVLVGSGVETARLLERTAREKIDNVKFVPQQSASHMSPIFAWADALLIHLKDDPLFAITVPSKTQTYMASGKPVLCGVKGDARAIVQNAGCGIAFDPESPVSMEDAVRNYLALPADQRKAMGDNGRAYYESHFSQNRLSLTYSALFASVIGPSLKLEVAESTVAESEKAA